MQRPDWGRFATAVELGGVRDDAKGPQMSPRSKKKSPSSPTSEPVIEFEVDSDGTLRMAGHVEPKTNAELYEDVAADARRSPHALANAMDLCRPLAEEVHSLYEVIRDELSADISEAQKAGAGHKKRLSALQKRLRAMPEEPEEGVAAWLRALTTREFHHWVVPEIERWFGSAPDWRIEEEYLPQTATARGAAMEFFESMGGDELETLGVDLIEGEHPGSSYHAAELSIDIDEANRAAAEAGIAVRFVASKR